MIADKDLISIQEARILLEEAKIAQRKLADFSQEKLDSIFDAVLASLQGHLQSLAIMSQEETGYGIWQDKLAKNTFVCKQIADAMRHEKYVGILAKDSNTGIMEVGVPYGVIVCAVSRMSPVSSTIHNTLLALKSGNSILFSLHPKAAKSMKYVLDIMIMAAQNAGLPKNALSYLETVAISGVETLFNHPATSLILLSGASDLLQTVKKTGKAFLYGGTGQGPVFIEKSANLAEAVDHIFASKTFDNGIAPSAENCLILEASIAEEAKQLFIKKHAYFLSDSEAEKLASVLFCQKNERKRESIGLSAMELAKRASISVPENTLLLVVDRQYVRLNDPYLKELFAPVLTCYIEDDWQNACEKCIELLIAETSSHTLTIHTNDEYVVEQFALKKPIARLLVNSPAVFGAIGFSTMLTPSLALGSSSAGLTADSITPANLTYRRKVAYGLKNANQEDYGTTMRNTIANTAEDLAYKAKQDPNIIDVLEKVLRNTLTSINKV